MNGIFAIKKRNFDRYAKWIVLFLHFYFERDVHYVLGEGLGGALTSMQNSKSHPYTPPPP